MQIRRKEFGSNSPRIFRLSASILLLHKSRKPQIRGFIIFINQLMN